MVTYVLRHLSVKVCLKSGDWSTKESQRNVKCKEQIIMIYWHDQALQWKWTGISQRLKSLRRSAESMFHCKIECWSVSAQTVLDGYIHLYYLIKMRMWKKLFKICFWTNKDILSLWYKDPLYSMSKDLEMWNLKCCGALILLLNLV